jgi:hypothetical protein
MPNKVKAYVLYTYEQNPYRPDDWDYIPYAAYDTYEEAETKMKQFKTIEEDECFIREEYMYKTYN